MSTLANKQFDAIEHLIFTEGIRIQALDIHPELDVMTIYLNTKAVLTRPISSYKRLHGADPSQLFHYELIGEGVGVHWPTLDEDLSLKGFLRDELRKVVKGDEGQIAA
jgi:hypothetical protein